jgi:hypothetical protein
MRSFDQELAQPLRRERDRVRPGDADRIKTLRVCGIDQRRLERRRRQKSRLA